jgi:hypothetical protein
VPTACLSTGPWHKGLYNFRTSSHDRSNSYAVFCITSAHSRIQKNGFMCYGFHSLAIPSDELHFSPTDDKSDIPRANSATNPEV